MVAKGFSSPTDIKDEYEHKFPHVKTRGIDAYIKGCKRQGLTKEVRDKNAVAMVRAEMGKHILDFDEIKKYEFNAQQGHVQILQIEKQKTRITQIWELMNRSDPHTWTYESILSALGKKYKFEKDEQSGAYAWTQKAAVGGMLSAVNTMFPSIMPKGWSINYTRTDRKKDYFTFAEMDLFLENVADTVGLSREGWGALFAAQVNLGCREGVLRMFNRESGKNEGRNGILSLRWENIDYTARRTSLHEKGGRGKSSRVWEHLPLDLFPWLKGWDRLMAFHVQKYGYAPSNDNHESGPCFDVTYDTYSDAFKSTRKRCNGRIAGDKETFTPHILRKSHAQWLVKLYVPLEQICGQFPDGYFGVGWDNPQILLKYYVTMESEQREKAEQAAKQRMIKLGMVAGEVELDPKDKLIADLTAAVKALTGNRDAPALAVQP